MIWKVVLYIVIVGIVLLILKVQANILGGRLIAFDFAPKAKICFIMYAFVMALFGLAGYAFTRYLPDMQALNLQEFHYKLYAGPFYKWGKYPLAFGGIMKSSWEYFFASAVLSAVMACYFAIIQKRGRKYKDATSKSSFIKIVFSLSSLVIPVAGVMYGVPYYAEHVLGKKDIYGYIFHRNLLEIPFGEDYYFWPCLALDTEVVVFSFFAFSILFALLDIHRKTRLLPIIFHYILCLVMIPTMIFILHPLISIAFPLFIVIVIILVFTLIRPSESNAYNTHAIQFEFPTAQEPNPYLPEEPDINKILDSISKQGSVKDLTNDEYEYLKRRMHERDLTARQLDYLQKGLLHGGMQEDIDKDTYRQMKKDPYFDT